MDLTPRKKKALGFGVSGIVFIVVAIVFWTTATTPEWVNTGLAIIGSIANLVGLGQLVLPEPD
jgi:hypothetical protein